VYGEDERCVFIFARLCVNGSSPWRHNLFVGQFELQVGCVSCACTRAVTCTVCSSVSRTVFVCRRIMYAKRTLMAAHSVSNTNTNMSTPNAPVVMQSMTNSTLVNKPIKMAISTCLCARMIAAYS
jgi:hypothetical protein